MPADIEAILKLEVPVIVQIASRMMHVEEVVNLNPGSIVELPKPAEDDLELMVNNKTIGLGAAVKVGENFGIRVTFVGDMRSRLEAMAAGGLASTAVPCPATPADAAGGRAPPVNGAAAAGEPA
jgi:flagellar motor switch protein FliN/FliY